MQKYDLLQIKTIVCKLEYLAMDIARFSLNFLLETYKCTERISDTQKVW